jgi:hypothetical protein
MASKGLVGALIGEKKVEKKRVEVKKDNELAEGFAGMLELSKEKAKALEVVRKRRRRESLRRSARARTRSHLWFGR